ncbi:MAG: 50S ribosomal protein L9 [Caldilineae bacterium]|nr:MAG: 50S ribosomal protein L9 [Caldilineae bacterium]
MARMKVLLTEDVPNLGLAGEIHTVAGGYARNYLIPRGEAILATKGAVKQAQQIREAAMRKRAKERANAEAQAALINGKQLLFQVRAGENDRLYGSITTSDIAEQLEEQVGFEVDRRRILLDASIRELGLYDVTIHLMPEVDATFQVAVVREGETWADAERRQAEKEAAAQAAAEAEAAAEMMAEAAEEAEEEEE